MAKTTVKLLNEGFTELRKCDELTAFMRSIADEVAANAGEGYAADTFEGKTRNMCSAYTESFDAMRACAKDAGGALLRALQS